jgi:hypothetical protein
VTTGDGTTRDVAYRVASRPDVAAMTGGFYLFGDPIEGTTVPAESASLWQIEAHMTDGTQFRGGEWSVVAPPGLVEDTDYVLIESTDLSSALLAFLPPTTGSFTFTAIVNGVRVDFTLDVVPP